MIFGTGAGGVNFYKSSRGRQKVIGFLDNNQQKQGGLLFGKTIYAPRQLTDLSFDKIIIASDYYREIQSQLIDEFAISEDKITVYWPDPAKCSRLQSLRKRFELLGYERICTRPGWVSDWLYRFIVGTTTNNIKRLSVQWLDEVTASKVHIFRSSMKGQVQGPRYLNQHVAPTGITLPEVALYHFRHGQVCSVSRSVILPDEQIVIERVTTSASTRADYSGAHLLHHGKSLALVRALQPERIEKGILISGCNELNYYHWVLEILTQLQFVEELPPHYADYPILISVASQKISSIKTLIESFGINRPFIYLSIVTAYKVDDLLLIGAPNNAIPNLKGTAWNLAENSFARHESIMFLREKAFALSRDLPRDDLPKRVFLARKGFLRLYNQTEVATLLEAHGFVCVYMEDQDVSQQVAIMANAEIIVGPTGAAWTNILFATAGTKALCWMAEEGGAFSCFSNIAAIVGVEMDYISYRVGALDSRELYYKPYFIDPDIIATWLQSQVSTMVVEKSR
ncbi:glycosyltransferase family 61 protein [Pseudomonas sp. Root329]|uniref:glycosyltransferase family 61 protein n=1 Tax=Pseudomonas sp. Root329 TaxID=1736515 RepID=UPI001F3B8385|nr:glycosyltransferase family 61 protein [Pseudomonas sp. Root329]